MLKAVVRGLLKLLFRVEVTGDYLSDWLLAVRRRTNECDSNK